jgi:hypothetical protein
VTHYEAFRASTELNEKKAARLVEIGAIFEAGSEF